MIFYEFTRYLGGLRRFATVRAASVGLLSLILVTGTVPLNTALAANSHALNFVASSSQCAYVTDALVEHLGPDLCQLRFHVESDGGLAQGDHRVRVEDARPRRRHLTDVR